MDAMTILILAGVAYFVYAYMKEKSDHTKTKNELAVLKRMGELSELGQKLQDDQNSYNDSLANHTEHLIPDAMLTRLGDELPLPPGPVQDSPQVDKPIFFKGLATEDIRQGQEVDIEVQPTEGRTFVSGTTPIPFHPPGES